MKNFKEKEIKDLSVVNGGLLKLSISFSVNWDGWLDGSLFKGKGVNELDSTVGTLEVNAMKSIA